MAHSLVSDRELSSGELRVYMALLGWSRDKGYCWPSNESIGEVFGGRNPGHVARVLREMEEKGLIEREPVGRSPANPTGRLIHVFAKRRPAPAIPEAPDTPSRPDPAPPRPARSAPTRPARQARTEGESGQEKHRKKKTLNVGVSPGSLGSAAGPAGPPPAPAVPPSTPEPVARPTGAPETAAGSRGREVAAPAGPEAFAAAIAEREATMAAILAAVGGDVSRLALRGNRGSGVLYRAAERERDLLLGGDPSPLRAEAARANTPPQESNSWGGGEPGAAGTNRGGPAGLVPGRSASRPGPAGSLPVGAEPEDVAHVAAALSCGEASWRRSPATPREKDRPAVGHRPAGAIGPPGEAVARPGPVPAERPSPRGAGAGTGGLAEALRLAGRLRGGDEELPDLFARHLIGLFGPERDPARSYATYAGMARQVRQGRGGLTEGMLIGAIEEACRPGAACRGAAFTSGIRRRLSGRRRGRGPGAGVRVAMGP